jgi:branched-chain amino acid transport system permease protein
VPTLSSFVIYSIMIIMLLWRPQGLFARSASR